MTTISKSWLLLIGLLVCTAKHARAQRAIVIGAPSAGQSQTFSQGVLSGNTLYLSGQIGLRSDTLVNHSFEAEAHQALQNLKQVLQQAGMTMHNLVSVTVYLKDTEHYQLMNSIYRQYFQDYFPARTTVVVKDLVLNARIEVSGIASSSSLPQKTASTKLPDHQNRNQE